MTAARFVLERLFDPSSIFFPPYLAGALFIALIWTRTDGRNAQFEMGFLWRKKPLPLNRSTLLDLLLSLAFLLIFQGFLSDADTAVFAFTRATIVEMIVFFPAHWQVHAPPLIEAGCATLITMLAIDFASYGTHRMMHKWQWLWAIHSVHHAAERLTPLTTYRQHPFETLLLHTARAVAAGVGLGVFHLIFPRQTPVITVGGLGAGFFLYMFTVNLHHLEIPVRYPKALSRVFMSPHMHHLHHSSDQGHFNTCFGVVFSIWDRWFGTYHDERVPIGSLRFGLGFPDPYRNSLSRSLFLPLAELGREVLPAAAATGALLIRLTLLLLPAAALFRRALRLFILFGLSLQFDFLAFAKTDIVRLRGPNLYRESQK